MASKNVGECDAGRGGRKLPLDILGNLTIMGTITDHERKGEAREGQKRSPAISLTLELEVPGCRMKAPRYKFGLSELLWGQALFQALVIPNPGPESALARKELRNLVRKAEIQSKARNDRRRHPTIPHRAQVCTLGDVCEPT